MKAVFRVDASLKIGTGHVIRCLTLAQLLKENGVNVEFICRKHEGNLIHKIRSNKFNVFELELPIVNELDNKLFHSHWLGSTQQKDAGNCIKIHTGRFFSLDNDLKHPPSKSFPTLLDFFNEIIKHEN